MVRRNFTTEMLAISSRAFAFSSFLGAGRLQYDLLLREPHNKKSHADRSGDLGDHEMLSFLNKRIARPKIERR